MTELYKTISEPAALLKADTESEWLELLSKLIATHGPHKLSMWRDDSKHKNNLVHTVVERSYPLALKAMADMGFDLNLQRDSDKYTSLHLAIWKNKPKAIDALNEIGVDWTLKNKYGESCNDNYQSPTEFKLNDQIMNISDTRELVDFI